MVILETVRDTFRMSVIPLSPKAEKQDDLGLKVGFFK